ncbi:MAG: hypothetical protein GX094_12085 [Clostridiales bacterium]|nr:hypothetical protein [Clostridiales bacterium]
MSNENLSVLYQKTGGFIKGICHPNDNVGLLKEAGIEWVRRDVPFPYEPDGKLSQHYLDFKERSRMFDANGIRNICITPYPVKFIQAGIDVTTRKGLERVSEICAFLAEDFKDIGTCWQATNEMHIQHFRAPLNEIQAKDFLVACIKGIKEGNPAAAVGHNSLIDEWLSLCMQIEQETGGCDYVGLDLYAGTWSSGGPDTYCEKIDQYYHAIQKPIILMEFGFASKGDMMEKPEAEATAYLKTLGIDSIQDAISDLDALIDKLPEQIAEKARACAPEDKLQCVIAGMVHLLKKWPVKNDIPHTEEGQATFFASLLPRLLENPYLGGAVIYCLSDSERCFYCGQADCPCETAWGLIRIDGSKKPAFDVVKKVFTGK